MEFEANNEYGEDNSFQNLSETGVYDVKLLQVGYNEAKTGAVMINVTVDGGGKFNNLFYGGPIKKKDGTPGFENARLLQPLRRICNKTKLPTGTAIVKTQNGEKEVNVFTELKDVDIKIAVQRQWSDYKSDYEVKLVAVFNSEGLSAKELDAGKTHPDQINAFLSTSFKDKGPKGGAKAQAVATDVMDIDVDDVF